MEEGEGRREAEEDGGQKGGDNKTRYVYVVCGLDTENAF